MIKLVYCLRRRADVDPAEFYRYWHDEHGPLVRSFAVAIRARRYIQSHTCAPTLNEMFQASRGLASPYDGITEVWWDSEADFNAAAATPEAAEAYRVLIEDEAKFIDFTQSRVFITQEHQIFDFT
jgi:uncharacterized protein (TIGR02118 family)